MLYARFGLTYGDWRSFLALLGVAGAIALFLTLWVLVGRWMDRRRKGRKVQPWRRHRGPDIDDSAVLDIFDAGDDD